MKDFKFNTIEEAFRGSASGKNHPLHRRPRQRKRGAISSAAQRPPPQKT